MSSIQTPQIQYSGISTCKMKGGKWVVVPFRGSAPLSRTAWAATAPFGTVSYSKCTFNPVLLLPDLSLPRERERVSGFSPAVILLQLPQIQKLVSFIEWVSWKRQGPVSALQIDCRMVSHFRARRDISSSSSGIFKMFLLILIAKQWNSLFKFPSEIFSRAHDLE